MKRRTFIVILGGAAAWPLPARAQQPDASTVGFLRTTSAEGSAHLLAALRQGLGELGYADAKIEPRWAQGQKDRLPKLAAELVALHVAAIVVNHGAVPAAKAATATIPIVFVTGADPVATGLVPNLNRPGGNVTGVSFFDIPLAAKRLEILHTLLPKVEVIAALLDSNFSEVQIERRELQTAAHTLGQKIFIEQVGRNEDFDGAFSAVVQSGAGALLMGAGPYFTGQRSKLVELAARHAIPTSYTKREFVTDGGLLSYGASQADAYRRAGIYVARILKGEKPGDLPVELPTKFELAINLKTAKALGLTIPQSLLATADEVIE